MHIFIAGATGYIGRRLIPQLLEEGHRVLALSRGTHRIEIPPHHANDFIEIQGDLLQSPPPLPENLDVAYYLVHSMKDAPDFEQLEAKTAKNFVDALKKTNVKQIIFMSGIANEQRMSPHIQSRLHIEEMFKSSGIPTTILRAGIVIGSGSASFEIIRDLVEKLPIMVAPKWIQNQCQPIAIYDVIFYLSAVKVNPQCYNQTFDIGGPDILTYRDMLLILAKVRGLKRWIINVPFLSPRLSSYWLYLVTSTNFFLAQTLVENLTNNFICKNVRIRQILPHQCLGYRESVERAFEKIAENTVVSSWRDALSASGFKPNFAHYMQVPKEGCLFDHHVFPFTGDPKKLIKTIWAIGGKTGWYANDPLWHIRGLIDRALGGSGLRRGRTHPDRILPGDAIDFWRVLVADKEKGRLLLYAEMKLPGEAWLEFRIEAKDHSYELHQTATFRPKGVLGRFYWYFMLPFHKLIFPRMGRNILNKTFL
ncbi:MAG: SDR family oxidoreductase [Chlamydiales bacterium]|nr:SDR family oxidoreductase [Chlamydiales bacterium]